MAMDIDQAVRAAALVEVDDSTSLQRAGLDSLAVLRLAAQMVDEDGEVDPAGLADIRTVGDLKRWLLTLAGGGADEEVLPGPAPAAEAQESRL